MRPCTKEYSIYKLDPAQADMKRDQDLFTFCTTEVRIVNSIITNCFDQMYTVYRKMALTWGTTWGLGVFSILQWESVNEHWH